MENTSSLAGTITRKWVTPFTTGAFLLSAVTGILLFFKVHYGLIKWSHEWLSWLLVIGVVLHMFLNYRPLVRVLVHPLGKAILIVFTLLLALSFLPFAANDHDDHRRHGRHAESPESAPSAQGIAELAINAPNKS